MPVKFSSLLGIFLFSLLVQLLKRIQPKKKKQQLSENSPFNLTYGLLKSFKDS